MAYTPTTWVNGSAPALSATNLNHIETGISDAHTLIAGIGSGGGSTTRGQFLTVASSELNSTARGQCDYQCDGVDDQVQINQALARASRPADGFSTGEGYIGVALVGPSFFIGNDNTTSITMYPSTHLKGAGHGTLLVPMYSTSQDKGTIELINGNASRVIVSNLSIGKKNATGFNGHGIKFNALGVGDNYEIKSGNDPYNTIRDVNVFRASRKGIWCTGTAGGSREMNITNCVLFNCTEHGLLIDSSSDSQVINCRATGGGAYPGFELGGGNTMVSDCKAYYRGNDTGATTGADGFLVSSSRCMISNSAAQDCGGNGFNFTGTDVTAANLIADSCSTGFRVATDGTYSNLQGYARAGGAFVQTNAFSFSGSPQVFLTGAVGDATAVSGTAGTNSFVRIVRSGTTLFTAG